MIDPATGFQKRDGELQWTEKRGRNGGYAIVVAGDGDEIISTFESN